MRVSNNFNDIDRVFIAGLSTWIPCDRGSFRRLEGYSPDRYSWMDNGWAMEFAEEGIIGVGLINDETVKNKLPGWKKRHPK